MSLADEIAERSEARARARVEGRSRWSSTVGLHWISDGDSLTVGIKRGHLRGGARVSREGATCMVRVLPHLMPWSNIAALSWDFGGNLGVRGLLCVCEYGSPYPHPMAGGSRDGSELRELLAEVRPFVESMGSEVIDYADGATFWWHLDPRSGVKRSDDR